MDIPMPVMDGVQGTREICQRFPQTKILVLTTFDDQEYVAQALQARASGYFRITSILSRPNLQDRTQLAIVALQNRPPEP